MINKVVHFEIAADDLERAKRFYESIFDWQFITWSPPGGEVDYILINTVATDERGMPKELGGVNGGMFKRSTSRAENGGENAYVCTVAVANIDETLRKVEANGGVVVMPKDEVEGIGFTARCLDSEGNIFGLLQPA